MKHRLTIIVIAVIIILGGFLFWNNHYLSTLRGDAADFTVRDTASVTKMFFADKNANTTLLCRTEHGWTVNNEYDAQQKLVNEILYTLDHLRIRMPVSLASHDNVITRMASTNTKVEIYQNVPTINLFNRIKLFYREKKTKTFYIGDVTQDNNGTYVLKEGADKAYIVYLHGFRGSISSRFSANQEDWRSHKIMSYNMDNIASYELEVNNNPERSFILSENGRNSFIMNHLNGNEIAFDTLRVLNLLTSLNDIRFEAFLSDVAETRRDSIINSPYLEKLTVTDKSGKVTEIKTFKIKINADAFGYVEESWDDDPDHKYALINGKDFVLIQDFVFGKLLKPATYYMKSNVEPTQVIYYRELEEIQSR